MEFANKIEDSGLNSSSHCKANEQKMHSKRKREASTSLSEDLKRYNDKILLTSELIESFLNHSPVVQNENLNTLKLDNSDANMNNCWSNTGTISSLCHNANILQNMTIDFHIGGKSEGCLENTPSTSNSDLSVHSASTSVGIQEDLDCLHLTDEMSLQEDVGTVLDNEMHSSPLVPSLFHRVPPTIYFSLAEEKVQCFPPEICKLLKWRTSTIMPALIRETVEKSGFCIVKDGEWLGLWGKHMKCATYHTVFDFQKVNHFPGSFHLGRKDRMWQNYKNMRAKYIDEFSFFPETYIFPQDARNLRKVWEADGPRRRWIIKPPASARGTGIKVINKWNQIPKKRPVIVQRYISEPYLINDSKFDLRVYVLVSSYDPLRIYVFNDGLVRFASVKYSTSPHTLSDSFMHLTNYSINKKSSTYTTNENENHFEGHKWTLTLLKEYLEKEGIDYAKIWETILDIVIKTIISSESHMTHLIKDYAKSRYNCFELFGFDIMLDKNMKPWLLEVNISPSLQCNSAADLKVKGELVKDMLNIAGYNIPNVIFSDTVELELLLSKFGISLQEAEGLCMNKTLHSWYQSPDEKIKHTIYREEDILDKLTPDDVRYLIENEDELNRSGSFIRIFPTHTSSSYLQFFEHSRYYNVLLDAWERRYHNKRTEGIALLQNLCQKNYHLQTVFKENPAVVKDDLLTEL